MFGVIVLFTLFDDVTGTRPLSRLRHSNLTSRTLRSENIESSHSAPKMGRGGIVPNLSTGLDGGSLGIIAPPKCHAREG